MPATAPEDKAREARLRRQLVKYGYQLVKSRIRNTNIDDFGGYMIIVSSSNGVFAGSRFDLNLDDVQRYVNE